MRNLTMASSLPFALALTVAAAPSGPAPDTLQGWSAYAAATDRRVARELADGARFLALDFGPDAGGDRRLLTSGAVLIRPVETGTGAGRAIDVPSGLVHHWRGAVLVPGLELPDLLRSLQQDVPDTGQEDVLQAAVLARAPDAMTVFLKLRRTRFVTAVYDTEHRVRFRSFGPSRAFSASTATKIAELDGPGTPHERELPVGQDRGFLWRWTVYWRYEQRPEGVILECESLSLSRSVPFGLGAIVRPLIESTARDSMERTLTSMRAHFRRAAD